MNEITVFGVSALTFMMAMYALEGRHPGFTLAFAFGCLLSSVYGFLIGAWPFGVVEIIWCGVALRKFQLRHAQAIAVRVD
ncbi:MAG: hypothetical protein E6I30_08515 [Chloroflexi bacterium]|nr:MAG: hypothetical protein E6I30_08515 [Chloroflexota bacterium]